MYVTIISIVKLSDDCYELAGKAKLLHYFPRALSAYRIEGLGQVKEGHEVIMLLLAFFPGAGIQQIMSAVPSSEQKPHLKNSQNCFTYLSCGSTDQKTIYGNFS